jgi:long-chain fatty acid transport protein
LSRLKGAAAGRVQKGAISSRQPGRRPSGVAARAFRAKAFLSLAAALAFWGLPAPAGGAGFTIFQHGTAAMGQGAAFVAEANDPSAIFYNPAGLNQLKRPEIYVMGLFNQPDREFHGPGGLFSQTNHRIFASGAAYVAIPFNNHVAAGIGFFAPFGLGSQWPPTWEGRYITTFSTLKTYNLNPVISIRPIERFSLAFGFNVMWSSVELKRKIPVVLGPFQFPDGESQLKGEGQGFGFNLGALLEVTKGVKLGLSYRSEIGINHKGDLDLTTLPAVVPGPRRISGSAHLSYPPLVTMGISVSRFPPLTFNFDATWTGWSSFDEVRVNLSQPVLVNGVPTTTTVQPKNWKDTWTFRFGMNYQATEKIKLRAGYIFDLTPVPDETFDPQVPNGNRHIFTAGADWQIKGFTLGLAYNYVRDEERRKDNQLTLNGVPFPLQANGRYQSDAHLLGLSVSYRF